MNRIKKLFTDKHFKHGSYSIMISVIVIAIVIVANMILNQLPAGVRNIDMTSTKIYDIGDTSKEVIGKLDKDVKIHIIAEEKILIQEFHALLKNMPICPTIFQ